MESFKIPFSNWYVHTHRWTTKQKPLFDNYTIVHGPNSAYSRERLVEHYVRIGQVQFIITTLPF